MRRFALYLTVVGMAAGTVTLTGGCVQQDMHDRALMASRTKDEQIAMLTEDLEVAQANLATVRTQAKADIEALQRTVTELESAFDSESQRSQQWLKRVSEFGPLPLEIEAALEQLSGDYPDLLAFDAKRGMLRFASEVTFNSGSDVLNPDAAPTIATLADILNGPAASTIEIQLIGHTDNVPIGRPITRQKHGSNVGLSVHRAIAVRNALADAGVDPTRFMVAGYGEFRPIVANHPKNGAAENRRVELRLVPMVTQRERAAKEAQPLALPDVPSK